MAEINVKNSKFPGCKRIKYGDIVTIYLYGTVHGSVQSCHDVTELIMSVKPCVLFTEASDTVLLNYEYFCNDKYSLYNILTQFGIGGVYQKFWYHSMENRDYVGKEFLVAYRAAQKLGCDIKCIENERDIVFSQFVLDVLTDIKNHIGNGDGAKLYDIYRLRKQYKLEMSKPCPNSDNLMEYWKAAPRLYKSLVSDRDKIMAENIVKRIDLMLNKGLNDPSVFL